VSELLVRLLSSVLSMNNITNSCAIMQGMWTRFFPAVAEVRRRLSNESIGEVKVVQANFGFKRSDNSGTSRLDDPNLGGGAVLDVGVYPISLATMVFKERPSSIHATGWLTSTGKMLDVPVCNFHTLPLVLFSSAFISSFVSSASLLALHTFPAMDISLHAPSLQIPAPLLSLHFQLPYSTHLTSCLQPYASNSLLCDSRFTCVFTFHTTQSRRSDY
jgi:hypothetical protein